MYEDTQLWQDKLEYLKDLQSQYIDLDKSWWDERQWGNYNGMFKKLEKKIADYEKLIDYLKNSERIIIKEGYENEKEIEKPEMV